MQQRTNNLTRLEKRTIVPLALAALVVAVATSGAVPLDDAGPLVDLTAPEESAPAAGDVDPSRVIIGFRDGIPVILPDYVSASGGEVVMQEPALGFIVVSVEPERNDILLAAALSDERVGYAELDAVVTTMYTPNDVLWSQQHGTHLAMKLPDAWDITLGSHDVDLHILDTGIDHTHLDLMDNLSPQCDGLTKVGWSTVGAGHPGGQDSGFHGTHVAGIAGAVIDNTLGIAGTSQSCMTSVQVLAADSGLVSWVAAGIRWSTDNGADIISMSLGGPSGSGALSGAVDYAYNNGVLLVAAAGNDGCAGGSGNVGFPAKYDNVMAVAALTRTGSNRAGFSNCGPEVEISAPGSGIWSTLPGNTYGPLDGTSMATPFVSGIAGLVWSANATLTNVEVRCILTATAVNLGPSNQFGWGRANAFAAVTAGLDPVTAAKDPAVLDTSRGECPAGIFEEEEGGSGSVFDPGHAYVDMDNNGLFDGTVDLAIPAEVIHAGTYEVANATHGLVIPQSVGAIGADRVQFVSGEMGHLILRTDLEAIDRMHLRGGLRLDLDGVQADSGGRMDLESAGGLNAAGAVLTGAGVLRVQSPGSIHLGGTLLTSMTEGVWVQGDTIEASGATFHGHASVRLVAVGDLVLGGASLAATNGDVRLDSNGTVSL